LPCSVLLSAHREQGFLASNLPNGITLPRVTMVAITYLCGPRSRPGTRSQVPMSAFFLVR
ncbi:MAG TPA: hypothetical protein VGC53_17225, partial [Vicinamibacteria bacterium]